MNSLSSLPNKEIHHASELFHTRLTARLCVALACVVQLFSRILTVTINTAASGEPGKLLVISISFTPLMTLTVAVEYFLFRKYGPGILRYSQIVDLILLSLFIGDWTIGTISFILKAQQSDPALFSIAVVYSFIGFIWRALLVTLIVQKWQLKIIAPVIVSLVTTGYAMHYDIDHFYFYLMRCAAQLFNIVLILYCEDKIKWRMIWTNLEQEKWMQVNNFILNNIPENIMILHITGEVKFISDYCKSFMEKCHHASLETRDFFNQIKDLKQQQQVDESGLLLNPTVNNDELQGERVATENELISDATANEPFKALTDLILNFKKIIREKNLQERQFLIYNGKLKTDENHLDKSIEAKISFLQHFQSEYLILILRDTTQRDLLVTLEKTNKYKDQLLASVSHELRTPLNGNINLVESAINSPKIPEEMKESLLVPALRSSKFLLNIINDILDMSQIKENKLRLIYQPADLKETLQSTAQLIELQAKKKGIKLVLEFDPSLPAQFCTDHMRLSQIVLNLLSNALKFTNKGTVKLLAAPMDQAQWVKICVQDSGIGMSEENLKKLFSNYTHIEFEGRQAMNPTGVGLGLNIAYKLVQFLAPINQQNIQVVSIPNKGSTFSFILENKPSRPSTLLEEFGREMSESNSDHIADELSGDKKMISLPKLQGFSRLISKESETEPMMEGCCCAKILIVDDNPFNTMAFEAILGSLDIKCDSVYSGSSAIEALREQKNCQNKDCKAYSVVFIDQEMPGMNGIEVVREIRRLQKESSLPRDMKIIGCTAHKSKEEVDSFLEAGLDQCIHKPISAAMIKDIL